MVPVSAGLLEKLDMPVMEQVGHHIHVYSRQRRSPFAGQALDDTPRASIGVKSEIGNREAPDEVAASKGAVDR
jgi:hypothetical protein